MADEDKKEAETKKFLRTYHWHFYYATRRSIIRATAQLKLFNRLHDKFGPASTLQEHKTMLTHLLHALDAVAIAKVFAGLASEAYINTYLFEHFKGVLGDDEFKKLEMSATPKKWAAVTELKSPGNGLKQGDKLIQNLYRVNEVRNSLVHPKPFMAQLEKPDHIAAEIAEATTLLVHVEDAILALHKMDPVFESDFVTRLRNKREGENEGLPGH